MPADREVAFSSLFKKMHVNTDVVVVNEIENYKKTKKKGEKKWKKNISKLVAQIENPTPKSH